MHRGKKVTFSAITLFQKVKKAVRIVIIIGRSLGTEKHKNTWTYQLIILENSSTWICLYVNHYMVAMLSVEVELNPCSLVNVLR